MHMKAVVICLKVLSPHLARATEENHEEPQ